MRTLSPGALVRTKAVSIQHSFNTVPPPGPGAHAAHVKSRPSLSTIVCTQHCLRRGGRPAMGACFFRRLGHIYHLF